MPKALIAYTNISPYDAVGYDAIEEARLLRAAGWEVGLYADSVHQDLIGLALKDASSLAGEKSSLLIYHHAVFWDRGFDLLKSATCKRVLRYHNVTPAHFFIPYSSGAYQNSLLARDQTRQTVKMGLDRVICDSNYNAREFATYGLSGDRLRVAPPFNRTEKLRKLSPNRRILNQLDDSNVKVFFVGRISPNKGHMNMLYTAYCYKFLFGDKVRFIIAGGMETSLASYYQTLQEMANRLGIAELIEYVGQVSDSELAAYFTGSDVFLVLSEHEGFCLPILEAQAFDLPVLSRDCTAIRETAGANQLIYENDCGFEILAGAIRTVAEQAEIVQYLAGQGRNNLERYSREKLDNEFLKCIEELL